MPIVFEPAGLAYFSVPKCACSSLKIYFFQLENGHLWSEARLQGEKKRLHEKFPSTPFQKVKMRKYDKLEKLAVIREPVGRLLSCYNNKIIKTDQLSRSNVQPKVAALGLDPEPDFETFFRNLDGYREASFEVARHSQSLGFWLGDDASIYDHLFDMANIDGVEKLLKSRLGPDIPSLPHTNKTAPRKRFVRDVSPELRAEIEEFYRDDYTHFGAHFQTH